MQPLLCSNEFNIFFDILQDFCMKSDDSEALFALIKDNLPPIADLLNIGKFDADCIEQCNHSQKNGFSRTLNIYSSEGGYSNSPEQYIFEYPDSDTVIFNIYPIQNHTWSSYEKSQLCFLSKNMHLCIKNMVLTNSIKKIRTTDGLTGINNAIGINMFGAKLNRISNLIDYNIAFLNIDNFKYVNKLVGSKQGDNVLTEYATKLRNFSEEVQGACGRMGGDNFVCVIPKDQTDDFLKFMDNISITLNIGNSSQLYDLKTHIGLYYAEKNVLFSEATEFAFLALNYARKNNLITPVWFSQRLSEDIYNRKKISESFEKSLNDNDFIIYYQPKIDLKSGSICGAEALSRWSLDQKLMLPEEYINILEDEGYICELDLYVLDKVCKDIHCLIENGGEPVKVSINFSKQHLRDKFISEKITEIIKNNNTPAKYIELEFPESCIRDTYFELVSLVSVLDSLGVSITIDNFGSGITTITHSEDLKIRTIKLDKSFICNDNNSPKAKEIVLKNIVSMMSELGIDVVAKNIETVEQAKIVEATNCTQAEGFFYSRPLTFSELNNGL